MYATCVGPQVTLSYRPKVCILEETTKEVRHHYSNYLATTNHLSNSPAGHGKLCSLPPLGSELHPPPAPASSPA